MDGSQQRPLVLVPLLVEFAQAEVDSFAATTDETQREPIERFLIRLHLVRICPGFTGGPLATEHIGMGKRLVKTLRPAPAADVEPELVLHRLVAHQEGVRGRQEHGVVRLQLPTPNVLGGDDAIVYQLQIFPAD